MVLGKVLIGNVYFQCFLISGGILFALFPKFVSAVCFNVTIKNSKTQHYSIIYANERTLIYSRILE